MFGPVSSLVTYTKIVNAKNDKITNTQTYTQRKEREIKKRERDKEEREIKNR